MPKPGQRWLFDNENCRNQIHLIDAKFILEIIESNFDTYTGKVIKIFKKNYFDEGFVSSRWLINNQKEVWTYLENQDKEQGDKKV